VANHGETTIKWPHVGVTKFSFLPCLNQVWFG